VLRISRLVVIGTMTIQTYGGSSFETSAVTFQTFCVPMGSGQRESRAVVIKFEICISRGVTGQTELILILIPAHSLMLVIGLGIEMTGYAAELTVIRRILMALQTLHPFIFMLAAENGEIAAVMVKS